VTSSKAFSLLVKPQLVISTASPLSSYTLGTGTYSTTFTATGGTAPYSFSHSGGTLPTGLLLSSGGVLSGTPSALGSYSFTVSVTDSTGTPITASKPFVMDVVPPPLSITTATALPVYLIGTGTYSTTITATGGVAPYSFQVTGGTLPTNVTLDPAGLLSGIPADVSAATYNFTVTVTDSQGVAVSVAKSFTLDVQLVPLSFTTAGTLPAYSLASGPINFTFAATGGTAPYTFSSTGAAALGFSFNSSGQMTGTPTAGTGLFNFSVSVTDSAAKPALVVKSFSINITP
jgi:hypothetical protein